MKLCPTYKMYDLYSIKYHESTWICVQYMKFVLDKKYEREYLEYCNEYFDKL